MEIVGLVKDAKYSEVTDATPPLFFLPYRQNGRIGSMTFYVRTTGAPEQIIQTIQRLVASVDAHQPVENLRTMQQQVLATLLAAIGLYGVLAYTVAQRTREIGLRMALGAAPNRVRARVLRQVGVMTLIGGTIGLVGAVWAGRAAKAILYQMEGHDPVVLVTSVVVLGLVALGAGFIPAHRASRVDPMLASRCE